MQAIAKHLHIFHVCGGGCHAPQSLARLMQEAGLVNVRQEPAQFKLREPRDMRMVGEKRR
jgi:hypothetical protein